MSLHRRHQHSDLQATRQGLVISMPASTLIAVGQELAHIGKAISEPVELFAELGSRPFHIDDYTFSRRPPYGMSTRDTYDKDVGLLASRI